MEIVPELGELELNPLRMSNGLPKAIKIPTLFTLTLGYVLNPLWKELSEEGQGIKLDDLTIPFLVYSDKMYAVASSEPQYLYIVEGVREELRRGGWSLPWSRADTIVVNDKPKDRRIQITKKDSFKAVGVQITMKARTHK